MTRTTQYYACSHGIPGGCQFCNATARQTIEAERDALREALRNWRTWHAEHFGDFSQETNAQLLCLDNDSAVALGDES